MRACDATKAINRWLFGHGRKTIERKQSYVLFADEVKTRLGLANEIGDTKRAKAFICAVAEMLD